MKLSENKNAIHKKIIEAGEMVQHLRARTALAENST